MNFRPELSWAQARDADDPLGAYRAHFHIPKLHGSEVCYLAGHSLGLEPKSAREFVDQELADWAKLGVEAHFQAKSPWLPYHEFLSAQTARLAGAQPGEVVAMNSLTINLHLMMVSFYRPTPRRYKIVMEANAFPSDRYAVHSQLRFHGREPAEALLEIRPRPGEATIEIADIESLLEREGESIALVLFPGVQYVTGQTFDMAKVSRAAHAQGALVGFDLAHAVGNIPLSLHDWGPDFAVWCSYKYLNGGPGCPGGCFVHARHAEKSALPRFAGWWGTNKQTRFLMGPHFDPIPGAEGWQVSNPPILSMAALRASMAIFDEVGMSRLRAKSLELTGYLEYLLDHAGSDSFAIITPRDPVRRGAQLSIRVPVRGRAVLEALVGQGIMCDWREPDVIRVAPVPLYNRFADVFRFAQEFGRALAAS
jgi:kynureninase